MNKICLNMIVKNESEVIERCLASVQKIIDSWIIVDTGSTDGTQTLIRKILSNKKGILYERPWIDFETNRNEALAFTQNISADYILFLDADEMLEGIDRLNRSTLNQDFYAVKIRDMTVDFHRILLIRSDPKWRWEGILHETLTHPNKPQGEILPSTFLTGTKRDGARAKDPKRYRKDAAILEKALQKNPNHPRTLFYLAQSYASGGERRKALTTYQKRTAMQGQKDELFLSHYFSGCLAEDLGENLKQLLYHHSQAIQQEPFRAEPLAALARIFLKKHCPFLTYLLTKNALNLPIPKSLHYIRREVYDYQLLFFHACAAQSLKKKESAFYTYQLLLKKKNIPSSLRKDIQRNLSLLK